MVTWDGIPLSHLLRLAGMPGEFDHVSVESITGYSTQISKDDVSSSGTMIALKAGGVPLNVEHGYPARLVCPTRQGFAWVKYVGRITYAKS